MLKELLELLLLNANLFATVLVILYALSSSQFDDILVEFLMCLYYHLLCYEDYAGCRCV